MQVNYLLVGNGEYPCSVLVDPRSNVEALIAVIKKATELPDIEPCPIQLFLARNSSGDWIRSDADEVDALVAGDEATTASLCVSALVSTDPLSQHFPPIEFGCRDLHVLVRSRKLTEAEVCQIAEEELELQCLVAGDWDGIAFPLKVKKSDRIKDLQLMVKREKYEHRVEVRVDGLYLYRARNYGDSRWLEGDYTIQLVKKGDRYEVPDWTHHKLDPESNVGDVLDPTNSEQGCIHVLIVPPPTWRVTTQQDQQYVQPYQEAGRRLKNATEVIQIVQTVKKYSHIGRSATRSTPPFVLLPGSRGVGKTQTAFNLMARDDVEVIYVPCSQTKWAFTDRYDAFTGCVERDILDIPRADVTTTSKQQLLYTYGFIWALVSGVSEFTGPRTRNEVVDALNAWQRRSRGKSCVFFLDNFPWLQDYEHEKWVLKLGLMRNVFRSLGLVAVISADSISASDMLESTSFFEKEGDSLWAIVFPTFPRFQHPTVSQVRPDLRLVIQKSRPLLATKALEFVQAHPLSDDMDLVTYLDGMTGKLVKHNTIEMSTRGAHNFYHAQYCVFFNICYSRTRGGHRIYNHYECLRETEPFELRIQSGSVCKNDRTWFVLNIFPLPTEDALFHLCVTGGKNASAFVHGSRPTKYDYAKELASRCSNMRPSSDSGVRQEAEVCGALVVASRHNGLAGSSFPSFFSRLLYEVEMQKSSDIQIRFPPEVRGFLSDLTVPFLAPSDVKWPAFLLQTSLNLGTLTRLTSKDKGDVSFMGGKVTAHSLSPNDSLSKSSLIRVLRSIPTKSMVHLVVTHSLQRRYFNSRMRDENGVVVVEDFQRQHLPKSLRNAHFYRIGVKLSSRETDADGRAWRNDLKEVRGLSNADVEGEVSKVVIFVEMDQSKKQQQRKRKWEMKQQMEAEARKRMKLE